MAERGALMGRKMPRLLDLFCGAGGASVGYHRAGFGVIGVDIAPQPNYPFEFIQADVLGLTPADLTGFDVVHASPPCQHYSAMSKCRPGLADKYPDLIAPVRDMLEATGAEWVIENVPGAPLDGITLCGFMFGLPLYRHRIFEASFSIEQPYHRRHTIPASRAGHWEPGTIMSVSGHVAPIAEARRAMGTDWMTRDELTESIPPKYTEYVGLQAIAHMRRRDRG